MQFIDLRSQYRRIQDQVRGRIDAVLEHGQFVLGPELTELEQRLAEQTGVRHVLGLPMHPYLAAEDQRRVARRLVDVLDTLEPG